MPRARHIAALLGLAVAAGCSEPFAPADLAGDYTLESLSTIGRPGDVRVIDGYEYRVVYDSVTLRADGTARTASRQERRSLPDGAWTPVTSALEWDYGIDGLFVELREPPCPPGRACDLALRRRSFRVAAPHALVAASGASTAVYTRNGRAIH